MISYPMAITIALSFCGTNLLEPEEGGEEPELEVELSKLNHLCAAFRQIFLLSDNFFQSTREIDLLSDDGKGEM